MHPDKTIPSFLWRAAWASLFTVIAVGLATVVVLAGGAADPPRAGPVVYESTTANNIPLPTGPYTLEITGRLQQLADRSAAWGIELTSSPSPSSERGTGREVISPLRILINGYGFFSVSPPQSDFTPFIHIRTHGESNKLTLNVGKDGDSVLRINDEIAWKGVVPPAHDAPLRVMGNGQFSLEHIALYAP